MDIARPRRLFISPIPALILAGIAAVLGACRTDFNLIGSSGRYVGQETLNRIEPGTTDEEWVRAVLGKPKEIEPIAQGRIEIWKYQYERVRSAENAYLVNADIKKPENVRFIYVQLADGVVTDWWKD